MSTSLIKKAAILLLAIFFGGMAFAQGVEDDLTMSGTENPRGTEDLQESPADNASPSEDGLYEAENPYYPSPAEERATDNRMRGMMDNRNDRGMDDRKGRGNAFSDSRKDDSRLLYADEPGILIADIFADSPAAQAGIIRGDVVTAFEGTEVSTIQDIASVLEGYEHGQEVQLTLLRGGNEITLSLVLETRVGYPLIGIVGGGFNNRNNVYSEDEYYEDGEESEDYDGYYRGGREDSDSYGRMFGLDRMFGPDRMESLDLELDELTPELLEAVMSGDTAFITQVVSDSPAGKAGVAANSVIIAVDEETLSDGDLAGSIQKYQPGDEVVLTVGTLQGVREITVVLGENDGKAYLGVAYYPLDIRNQAGSWFDGLRNSPRNSMEMPGKPGFQLPPPSGTEN